MHLRLVALSILLSLSPSSAAELETAEEIQTCIEENLPEVASIQDVVLRAVDRTGNEVESRAELFWKKYEDDRAKLLMRISAPPERRGSMMLVIDEKDRTDMWLYLPELQRVKRISERTISGPLFGTDYSYEDFLRVQKLGKESESMRLPDEVLDERPVYVLETRPVDETSEYERIKSFVDQERCVLLRAEHYESGDRLTKVLTSPIDKITQEQSGWVPRLTQMKDLLDQTYTDLIVEKIDTGAEVPDSIFSLRNLERGH